MMGYDYHEAGRIDETEHPFTTSLGIGDTRITTHYYEDNLESGLFSSIHEGGHAIYDQNMPHELSDYGLDEAPSMGIHESQSRFTKTSLGAVCHFGKVIIKNCKNYFLSMVGPPLKSSME